MTGGGSFPQPGEISLAHNGILYLDELPEYTRSLSFVRLILSSTAIPPLSVILCLVAPAGAADHPHPLAAS